MSRNSEEKELQSGLIWITPSDQKLLEGKDYALFYLSAHLSMFNNYLLSLICSNTWTGEKDIHQKKPPLFMYL